MQNSRLIHFIAVGKSYLRPGSLPLVILRPASISLPTDRPLAILGARGRGKTTVLQLMARTLPPDEGEVVGDEDVSPIISGGSLFHPQLSGIDNLRFISQAYGLDVDMLLMAIDSVMPIDLHLDQPWKSQERSKRRGFEAATIIVLSYGCYLFDEIGTLGAELFGTCREAAEKRGSGLVFTTSQPRLALQFAEAAVLIQGEALTLFQDVQEAVEVFQENERS